MVSLKDISARCGVSVATVSKALNDHKDVSAETKQRLLQVAKEMGYFPNSQARALKTNRTYNLGVMFLDAADSGLTHEFFAKILNSFKTEAENFGYDITFINRNLGKRKMTTYEHCKYRNVDGVLIACTDFTDPDVYEVINGNIALVTIDHIFDCRTAVLSDNFAGISALVEYVCNLGHKRLAFIQGNKSAVAEKPLAGFYTACMKNGIEVRPENVIVADYHNPDLTYKYTKELLSREEPPTCIFVPDDYSAIGGYNAAHDLKLEVGKDVSFVGYDGISYSQFLNPKLTTYKQDTEQLGKLAAQQLIKLIENPHTTFTEVLTVSGEMLAGKSVGELK